MVRTQWRQVATLGSFLNKYYRRFDFFQSVRLLNRFTRQASQQTAQGETAHKSLKFTVQTALHYPKSNISKLTETKQHIQLETGFLGLTGPGGVLPQHYSVAVLKDHLKNQSGLQDFFGMFHHRVMELYYQAWAKYRLPIDYEQKQLAQTSDNFTKILGYFNGMQSKNFSAKNSDKNIHNSLLYLSGFISKQVPSVEGLKNLLKHYFGIEITIETFHGMWISLDNTACTQMPSKQNKAGQFNRLSHTAMIGQRSWLSQNRLRICLGPLNTSQYQLFEPGCASHAALHKLIKLYLGVQYSYQIQLILQPDIKLSYQLSKQMKLGWSSWLASEKKVIRKLTQT